MLAVAGGIILAVLFFAFFDRILEFAVRAIIPVIIIGILFVLALFYGFITVWAWIMAIGVLINILVGIVLIIIKVTNRWRKPVNSVDPKELDPQSETDMRTPS